MPFKDREADRAHAQKYRQEHREQILTYNRQYYQDHKEQAKVCAKKRNQKIKTEVLTHYGNGKLACVKCGFDDMRALSIDHINGKGNKHRKKIGIDSGSHFHWWLRKNNYPKGYQVLCMNCQFIKAVEEVET